jgi:hypothetical protein
VKGCTTLGFAVNHISSTVAVNGIQQFLKENARETKSVGMCFVNNGTIIGATFVLTARGACYCSFVNQIISSMN